jgi:uncharacterized protein (TIRG00374 family)
MKRTLLIVAMLFILYYLVLPQLARGRESADLISGVNPLLLVLALGLEVCALLAYTILAKVTLPPEPRLSTFTVLRIQMSTKAVTNVVPGGSAAGSTLGYRLYTEAGVAPTAAGFTLATVGLGSAVVLNLILWVTLLVSIPLKGVQPGYVVAAIIGVALLASAAALVWLLMEGRDRAERVLRAIARRMPFVEEDTAARFIHQLAERLQDLSRQPELVRRGILWAAAFWMLDASALWVLLYAFGQTVNPIDLIVAFGVAQVLAAVPITPGGLGLVEAALPGLLAGLGGVPIGTAVIAVLAWRFVQFWMPIPTGAVSYASLKLGDFSRRQRLGAVRELAQEVGQAGPRRVWDEATGEYRVVGGAETPPEATGPAADPAPEGDRR